MKNIKRFIIPIFIPHAGCPHRCLFCDQLAVTAGGDGKITRQRIVETVQSYTETRPDWDRDIELAYFGGSFTSLPMKRQLDLLKIGGELIDKGLIDALRISTRPDAISEKILGFLSEYGVRTIELGIQSMSDHVLELSQRGHTTDDARNAARLIIESGFDLIAQIMPGLPGDTEETIIKTAEEVVKLAPDGVRIYPAVILKDTEMERLYLEGTYEPLSLDETVRIAGLIVRMFQKHNIPVIRIDPVLVILIGRGQILVQPNRPLLRFSHLIPGSSNNKREGYPIHLIPLNPPHQVNTREDITPLVVSTHLEAAIVILE